MPRPEHLERMRPEDMKPLVGAAGPTLIAALQALVTWATSTAIREQLMADCDFPLPGDLPAFLLVNQLVYRGACRPTDMADAIQTGRSNVSKIVRRLEEAGLVVRAPDPADDRAVVVGLTSEGRATGRRIRAAGERLWGPAFARWTPDEMATLERLAIKMATGVDALPGHPLTTTAGVTFS